jgi:hypothetical protein
MVMVNTEKGQMLFESFKDALLYEYSSYEAASSVNHSMEMTASKGSQVIDLESQSLFDIDLVPKLSFKDKIKNRLPWQVKLMIKKWL